MFTLQQAITEGEKFLVDRVAMYAEKFGFTRFTPPNPDVWQIAIEGLSAGLKKALHASSDIPELSPEPTFLNDQITAFGVEQARQHRSRGVTLEMFLGLMKYFRQSYQDLISGKSFGPAYARWAHAYVARYFDRIELGFIAEWERTADELTARHEQLLLTRNAELAAANDQMQLEIAERRRAELQIRKLNADLEQRVAARTLQLQRINEQNNYRIRELALLNRFSRVNLSEMNLNRFSHLLLALLASPPFFDRAMLFLFNERSQTLQGMLGIMRSAADDEAALLIPEGREWDISEEEMSREYNSDFSRSLRTVRVELRKGRSPFQRAVAERRVVRTKYSLLDTELHSAGITGTYAVVPLLADGRVFGVVVVDNQISSRPVSINDLKFLELFANHAGVALANLILYRSLEDANQKLNETQEQLIHGERLATIGEMAAGIAHELKGPMVAIGGFARRLARKVPPDTPERSCIETIIKEEQRLEGMLDEVLSFSRKTTLCYDNCSVTDIVEGALSIVRHLCEKNRVAVIRNFPKKPTVVCGDSQQLKQVFINLFFNALDVMPSGGTLKVAVAPARRGDEQLVAVKVADTGGGIPKNLQNSIFSPFVTTKKNGTGLGLPIANRIITNHDGRIKVRNHAGGGAEFTVMLPVRECK